MCVNNREKNIDKKSLFICTYEKKAVLLQAKRHFMYSSDYREQLQQIEERGLVIMRDIRGYRSYGTDTIWPYLTFAICHRGHMNALYDMQEVTQGVNEVGNIMPGHMHRPLHCSEDYQATILVLSRRLFAELSFRAFSHDFDKYNVMPICQLTDAQAAQMMSLIDQLEEISRHTEEELPHRTQMQHAILSVGYEYLNLYCREQHRHWEEKRYSQIRERFCELVVAHYRESREVKYYADLMHLTPKYFSKVICASSNGMSPADWIEQYVATQAKHMLSTQSLTVKETAYQLGFGESASFCRFFKRITGLTPKEYRELKIKN